MQRYQKLLQRLPKSEVFQNDFERIDDSHAAENQMKQVLNNMGLLTDDELDVVSLCGWGGFDYATAAVSLDIPIGTIRSRLARARKKLAFAEDEEPNESVVHINTERRVTLRRMEKS